MQWWNDLIDWTSSDEGWRVVSGAVIPFLAILVAGIVAALIGRGATKRVVTLHEREAKNAAVAGLVSAARKAATWGSLGHDERAYADHLAEDADVRLRLLPVAGASIAADWAQHEIADIKKNSSTFNFQADQSLVEFRDRMLEWQARPARARKLFKSDLERWKFDSPDPDAELISRQQEWNADKVDASRAPEPAPTPTTTSLRPAQPSVPRAADDDRGGAGRTTSSARGDEGSAQTRPAAAGSSVRPAAPSYGADATVPITDNSTRPYSEGETTPIRPALGSPAFGSPSVGSTGSGSSTAGSSGPGWSAARGDAGDRPSGASVGATRTLDARGADPRSTGTPGTGSPAAGTPSAGTSDTGTASADSDNDDVVDDVRIDDLGRASDRSPAVRSAQNDLPAGRSADSDRDRRDPSDDGRSGSAPVDPSSTTPTWSVPTRSTGSPAGPADADETSEPPYANPVSASELRRRSDDDE
ncbi:hypothetical protein [Curtobacterium aetherium]|uniref:Uncharacterized protein n=1 Tax=Curtobacterium aetherium TaxID=2841594 RepID=A0ACD1E0L5_9MICO|nr:hypothetical protein [Curtobacterium sp. L6-1]QWS32348.1 hypothetical protein KM842_08455 [Curtobacterium sp. L6-1]